TMAETDPKSVQDLTAVVQTLLQQMQDKFQTIAQAGLEQCPLTVPCFLDPRAVDDMSCRIDDLERNIADLMIQAGVEELEGENKTPAPNKG
ncbi:HSBP1 protein, partial [Sylvia borin]|nr:HSBP1 protein [Sylvia borin]